MFAVRIRELRKKSKMTQKALADKLYVDCSSVTKWETGKAKPDFDKQQKLADIFEVSVDYLLGRVDNNLEVPSDAYASFIKVPVLGKIPAGIPIEAIEDIVGHIDIPESMTLGGKSFFALKIKGDSMIPKYEDGDIVLFEKTSSCDSGTDCAVMVNGDDATFKRVEIKENGIMLKPMNPQYETMFYTKEEIENKPVRIIGIARQVRRDV